MLAAASSECSSGCQSGWTTYLHDDDHSYSSCGKAPCAYSDRDYSEEDDLSMVSDASSGPLRQQCSAGSDEGAASHANNARAERRGRSRAEPAGRLQSKMAAAASLLEDTASSPAFFNYSSTAMSSAEACDGYRCAAPPVMDTDNAADFSCAFSATTGFKSPLNATPLGGYRQVHYSPAAAKPMSARQVCRENGGRTKRR